MKLSTANDLWRFRQDVTIELHALSHPGLSEFSRRCQLLLSQIDVAYPDDPFWRRYCSALRRIRFDLAANPISFNTASTEASEVLRNFRSGLERLAGVYPDVANGAIALVDAAELLVTSSDAPILEYLYFNELLEARDDERVGLVVREARYLPSLRDELVALDVDAVGTFIPTALRASESFEHLIFIGPTAWFPDHVVASPRAPQLGFVHFDWLGPNRPPRPLRPGPGEGTWEAQGFAEPRSSSPAAPDLEDQPVLDIVPSIDWSLILDQLEEAPAVGDGELVSARLCALEGGASVFLRGHEGAETSVLSIDQKQADVSMALVAELEPGDYLLLRTTGGGNFVVELAWKYLGEKAKEIQETQAHWKEKLGEAIKVRGADRVSRESTRKGARAANESNVLAWASEDRIQPRMKGDFIALLMTLGLEDKADQYWGYGRAIFRARIKAGHRIRKLLLEQVRDADIDLLEEQGKANFQLPDRHGGTITALRLHDLAPFEVEVPSHRIGVLLQAPELWPYG